MSKADNKETYGNQRLKPGWERKKNYALMLAVASAISSQAFAQEEASADEDSVDLEEVVVYGMRQSLETAQDLKRDAATVIDSITAEDLGSFPDKSVAEALQRVAGVTVNRFAASSDTAHFSAEPSGVIVRGLTQVRTEFNGRDSFSANSSRGLSWGDISPELMAGVDTYKNQMAELIEGGIAGSVNMRTRVPFDQEGQMFAATVAANYGDLSEELTPEGSMLYSNRWDVSSGEFGVLANIAYSNVNTRSEGNQLYRMNRIVGVYDVNGDGVVEAPTADLNQQPYSGADAAFFPAIINMRDNLYDRTRLSGAVAVQWQNADETLVVTGQVNRSKYENAWEEYVFGVSIADLSYGQSVFYELGPATGEPRDNTLPQPIPGTDDFTFDSQGMFQTGSVNVGTGWWGGDDSEAMSRATNQDGEPFVVPCYNNGNNGWDGNGCSPSLRGVDTFFTTRASYNENVTQDVSLNVKWAISERMRANFDVQKVDATVYNYDSEMNLQTFTNPTIDLRGDRPKVTIEEPTNVNWSDDGLTNPNNYFIKHISDHLEDSEGEQFAIRGDFEFDFETDHLSSIKVGARYADREQLVRWSNYNWQSHATPWGENQAHYFNIDQTEPTPGGTNGNQPNFVGYPDNETELNWYGERSFGSDYHNLNTRDFIFPNVEVVKNRELFSNTFGAGALGFQDAAGNYNGSVVGWDPICSNAGTRAEEIPGTCTTPAELVDVSEETTAAYVQLNFGGSGSELFGLPYSGNIGVRWIKTVNTGNGGIAIPRLNDDLFFNPIYTTPPDDPETPDIDESQYEELDRTDRITQVPGVTLPTCTYIPDTPQGPPSVPNTLGCYIGADDVAFLNDQDQLSTVETNHYHLLPSFNLKLEFTDQLQGRLAISRAMSRPDIGNLRNYVGVSASTPDANDPNDPLWIKDSGGAITGANVFYSAGGQNPFLKPIIADQVDLTLEWYFSDVGSLTGAIFTKDFEDYIQAGRYNRSITSGGVTRNVEVTGPINGDGARINGFEMAFQTFFEFLPEPFDGLGVQANFTYLDNSGISNTNVQNTVGDQGEASATGQSPDVVEVKSLESLSDTSYNIIGMYEKGDWSARLAYSWREGYLVTAVDCCVALPIVHDDYGQLDGSVQYAINDYLNVSFAVTNILGEETVTSQQVDNYQDGGKTLPTGLFRNDTTYNLKLTFKM